MCEAMFRKYLLNSLAIFCGSDTGSLLTMNESEMLQESVGPLINVDIVDHIFLGSLCCCLKRLV